MRFLFRSLLYFIFMDQFLGSRTEGQNYIVSSDDDECALGTDHCRHLGPEWECRNTLGSFRCEKKECQNPLTCSQTTYPDCPKGFHLNKSGACVGKKNLLLRSIPRVIAKGIFCSEELFMDIIIMRNKARCTRSILLTIIMRHSQYVYVH